jgi:hypothetical protein
MVLQCSYVSADSPARVLDIDRLDIDVVASQPNSAHSQTRFSQP